MYPIKDYITIGFLAFLFCFVLASCSKDKTDPEPTKEQLLVKEWTLASVSVNGQNIDITGYSVRFQSGGSFNFNTPGVPELPQSGNYTLNLERSLITLNGSIELPVRTLTANRLVFEHIYTNHKEGNVTVQFVLN